MSRLEQIRQQVRTGRIRLDAADSDLEGARTRLADAQASLEEWLEAQGVLQEAAQRVQSVVHSQIAGVVTRCLQTVYDDSLSFHVEFERSRGKTSARLFFKKGDNEVEPIEASALGWVEVAAFALRLAVLKLHKPPVAQVLVLDESFRMLDKDAKPKMAELMSILAREMNVQIIMVTHDDEFMTGKIVKIR